MAQKSILIIDDDEKLLGLLAKFLGENGFKVRPAKSPTLGLRLLDEMAADLVILDVMMPEMDGFEVCRQIRRKSAVPIIMLTARGDTTDKITGLDVGADDYLPKPFDPRELVARMNAIFRRVEAGPREKMIFGELALDTAKQEASIAGTRLDLSSAEFKVLELLASSPSRVFNRDQIIEALHGSGWSTFDRSVDVLVSRLRTKLGDDPKHPKYLRTIRGTGYRFVGSP